MHERPPLYPGENALVQSGSIGFLAQDLEKVFPVVVKTDDTDFKAVDYGKMSVLTIMALQDLYKKLLDAGVISR